MNLLLNRFRDCKKIGNAPMYIIMRKVFFDRDDACIPIVGDKTRSL